MKEDSKKIKISAIKAIFMVGGSKIFSLLSGLVRTKFIATMFGPGGIAIYGLIQQLTITASVLTSLGISTASTQLIGKSNRAEKVELTKNFVALFVATNISILLTIITFFLFSELIISELFSSYEGTYLVLCLCLTTILIIIFDSQMSVLQGLRFVKEYSLITILSSVIGTTIGIYLMFLFDKFALSYLLLIINFLGVFFAYLTLYHLDIPSLKFKNIYDFSYFLPSLKSLYILGLAVGAFFIFEQITFLWIRSYIEKTLGLEFLGYFQAAYILAVTYVGIILSALSKDFLPSISAASEDPHQVYELISNQIDLLITLTMPALLIMVGFSSFIIELLFSSEFSQSKQLLSIMVIADIFKLVAFPIGFAILGLGDGAAFSRQGPVQLLILICLVYISIPLYGINAFGYIYIFTNLVGFLWSYFYLKRKIRYILPRPLKNYLLIAISSILITYYLGLQLTMISISMIFGIVFLYSFYGFRKIRFLFS